MNAKETCSFDISSACSITELDRRGKFCLILPYDWDFALYTTIQAHWIAGATGASAQQQNYAT